MTDDQVRVGDGICDVVCMGNAIVDWMSLVGVDQVERLGLAPGAMTLIDEEEVERLSDALGGGRLISGGSAANTAAGIASLGGHPTFCGTVGRDALGAGYATDLEREGVSCVLGTPPEDSSAVTGRCFVLVTPGGERTMATHLGAATFLDPAVVSLAPIGAGSILYVEGYLLDAPTAADALEAGVSMARRADVRVALSLSDPFVAVRHHATIVELLEKSVDILFANEAEILELTRATDPYAAAAAVAADGKVAFVTLGARGSVVANGVELIEVPPVEVDEVVDATGAGDLYAAGALYGLVRGASLDRCAALGSIAAGEVISHLGARPERSLAELVLAG